jgi:hypothetical protein
MGTRDVVAIDAALSLEQHIRAHGNYDHVSVRPRAGHLNVEVVDAQQARFILARATPIGGGQYGLSFRTHSGRWEPMPISGPLKEVAAGLVSCLAAYLDPRHL